MRVRGGNWVLLLAAIAAGSLCVPTAGAAASPDKLLASFLAKARAQRSVHYVTVSDFGNSTVTQVGDAQINEGTQLITIKDGQRVGGVAVIVTRAGAYVRGDTFALLSYERFKPAAAAKYAGKWILIPPTDPAYKDNAAGVTLASFIGTLNLRAPFSAVANTRTFGVPLMGVRGFAPAATGLSYTGILYANDTTALPYEELVSGGVHATIKLTRWNEALTIVAPTGATPIYLTGLE
jgi:hypothetical protein